MWICVSRHEYDWRCPCVFICEFVFPDENTIGDALVFSHVNLCFQTRIRLEMPLCFVLPAEWINPNCLTRPPSCFRSQGEMFQRTNLENKGLISADRNNKATLLLTIPRFVFKSSAKDLSPPISHYYSRDTAIALPQSCSPLVRCSARVPIRKLLTLERYTSSLSSMDSDLEAFSRNPTHGSVAALACQLTAKTNYANKQFLSY